MKSTRRDFVKKMAATASFAPFITAPFSSWAMGGNSASLDVSIFSKHL
ncbi:unnamed protein product, partial [Laminaria digitata]